MRVRVLAAGSRGPARCAALLLAHSLRALSEPVHLDLADGPDASRRGTPPSDACPQGWTISDASLGPADLTLVAVGPERMDEVDAARIAAQETLPWLLGCGRGGPAARLAFQTAMAANAPEARVLPLVLPHIPRDAADALADGRPPEWLLSRAELLRAVLEQALRHGTAPGTPDWRLDNDELRLLHADARGEATRLRDLADDLDAYAVAGGPSPGELGAAVTLGAWRVVQRPRPCLSGVVSGHPDIPTGRTIVTSEVFASGPGWVRTYSRLYALGAQAIGPSSLH